MAHSIRFINNLYRNVNSILFRKQYISKLCNNINQNKYSSNAIPDEHEDDHTKKYNYTKLKEGDVKFGKLITSAKTRKGRQKDGLCLLEGRRLINDALQAGVRLKSVYFTQKHLLDQIHLPEEAELYRMENNHLKMWSDVNNSSGIMALAYIPDVVTTLHPSLPITLVCDQIRDPGNMGTLLRTALAVGCAKVITTKGSCDVWDTKVLRSAMGAHFHLPIDSSVPWSTITNHFSSPSSIADDLIDDVQLPVYLATSGQDDHPQLSQNSIQNLYAPYDEPPYLEQADNTPDSTTMKMVDPSYEDLAYSKRFSRAPLDCLPYHKCDFTSDVKGCVLIIGGETEGISNEARQMTFLGTGRALTIPMCDGAESLNSSIAAAVILFEIKKQLTT